jgi:cytochrome c-type biogenesis protein CcsB
MFLAWSLSTFHLILENIESGKNQFSTEGLGSGAGPGPCFAKPGLCPGAGFAKQGPGALHSPSLQETAGPGPAQSAGPGPAEAMPGQSPGGAPGPAQNKGNGLSPEGNGGTDLKKSFFVGAFTSPTALFINTFATFRLPLEMQQSSPLVPALQSNWLMMHVTVMILSYSALICGSLLSIAFLIVTKNLQFDFKSEKNSEQTNIQVPSIFHSQPAFSPISSTEFTSSSLSAIELKEDSNTYFPQTENKLGMKRKFAENLDNLSYRILGIGFPLLTIGILSGAVWANEAWGSYWSWDPKETWALATWLVFAIYLHLRISKGWRGKKPAILASAGFVTVWICFLGVNLLGEGLHSYGFLKNSF